MCEVSVVCRAFPFIFIGVLYGCVSQPPLLVRATGEGGACTVQANGLTLSAEELDGSRLKALAGTHGGRVIVDADPHTPYRCIGGAIFNLQRAGLRIVSVRINGVDLPRE